MDSCFWFNRFGFVSEVLILFGVSVCRFLSSIRFHSPQPQSRPFVPTLRPVLKSANFSEYFNLRSLDIARASRLNRANTIVPQGVLSGSQLRPIREQLEAEKAKKSGKKSKKGPSMTSMKLRERFQNFQAAARKHHSDRIRESEARREITFAGARRGRITNVKRASEIATAAVRRALRAFDSWNTTYTLPVTSFRTLVKYNRPSSPKSFNLQPRIYSFNATGVFPTCKRLERVLTGDNLSYNAYKQLQRGSRSRTHRLRNRFAQYAFYPRLGGNNWPLLQGSKELIQRATFPAPALIPRMARNNKVKTGVYSNSTIRATRRVLRKAARKAQRAHKRSKRSLNKDVRLYNESEARRSSFNKLMAGYELPESFKKLRFPSDITVEISGSQRISCLEKVNKTILTVLTDVQDVFEMMSRIAQTGKELFKSENTYWEKFCGKMLEGGSMSRALVLTGGATSSVKATPVRKSSKKAKRTSRCKLPAAFYNSTKTGKCRSLKGMSVRLPLGLPAPVLLGAELYCQGEKMRSLLSYLAGSSQYQLMLKPEGAVALYHGGVSMLQKLKPD